MGKSKAARLRVAAERQATGVPTEPTQQIDHSPPEAEHIKSVETLQPTAQVRNERLPIVYGLFRPFPERPPWWDRVVEGVAELFLASAGLFGRPHANRPSTLHKIRGARMGALLAYHHNPVYTIDQSPLVQRLRNQQLPSTATQPEDGTGKTALIIQDPIHNHTDLLVLLGVASPVLHEEGKAAVDGEVNGDRPSQSDATIALLYIKNARQTRADRLIFNGALRSVVAQHVEIATSLPLGPVEPLLYPLHQDAPIATLLP